MSALRDARDGIAAALAPIAAEIPGLQVTAGMNRNPTPPSIDVYGGTDFLEGAGFGVGQTKAVFTVRARVSTADLESGEDLLLRLLDPTDPASVEAALADTARIENGQPISIGEYADAPGGAGPLLGCEWRVSVFL